MCCRITVSTLDVPLATAVLLTGQFEPINTFSYRRLIPEEGGFVRAELVGGELALTLTPTIGMYEHHARSRITASVALEVAAKYAEKVNGTITQHANVTGCSVMGEVNSRTLAVYPLQPLNYDNLCAGFRQVYGLAL